MSKKQRILKKNKVIKKIWHPDSCLVFKSKTEMIVIGRFVDNVLRKLTPEDVELCKSLKFKPDPTCIAEVESSSEEESSGSEESGSEESGSEESSDSEEEVSEAEESPDTKYYAKLSFSPVEGGQTKEAWYAFASESAHENVSFDEYAALYPTNSKTLLPEGFPNVEYEIECETDSATAPDGVTVIDATHLGLPVSREAVPVVADAAVVPAVEPAAEPVAAVPAVVPTADDGDEADSEESGEEESGEEESGEEESGEEESSDDESSDDESGDDESGDEEKSVEVTNPNPESVAPLAESQPTPHTSRDDGQTTLKGNVMFSADEVNAVIEQFITVTSKKNAEKLVEAQLIIENLRKELDEANRKLDSVRSILA